MLGEGENPAERSPSDKTPRRGLPARGLLHQPGLDASEKSRRAGRGAAASARPPSRLGSAPHFSAYYLAYISPPIT